MIIPMHEVYVDVNSGPAPSHNALICIGPLHPCGVAPRFHILTFPTEAYNVNTIHSPKMCNPNVHTIFAALFFASLCACLLNIGILHPINAERINRLQHGLVLKYYFQLRDKGCKSMRYLLFHILLQDNNILDDKIKNIFF